jgi:hypothetical protein
MNKGAFAAQLNCAWNIICALGLDEQRVFHPVYPDDMASELRSMNYPDQWSTCLKKDYYDFLLSDHSLIQFRWGGRPACCLSYSYYECPFRVLTYPEFLQREGMRVEDVGDAFRNDYDTYAAEGEPKDSVTPVRYDYNPDQYKEGIHPASHVHIGHLNEIRLGAKRILKPVSFVLLVVRQFYPHRWVSLHAMQDAPLWCRQVRTSLQEINKQFWGQLDEREMVLL